jgi:hypothetical protein
MKIVIILSLFLASNSFAGRWTVKKEAPYELQALVESFNLNYLTMEEKEELKNSLSTLDSLMVSLEERDRFFIAKSTIYKWVLKNSPNVKAPKEFSLYDFNTSGKEAKLNSFSKWLLMSLKADVASITALPNYNSYLEEVRRTGRARGYQSLKKRIALIKPWAYLYTKESPDQISLRLIKYQFNLLNNLISQYKLYYRFKGRGLPQSPSSLAFFTFDDGTKKKVVKEEDRILSKLDKIIARHKKNKLPLPKNDWDIAPKDEWTPKDDMTLSKRSQVNLRNPAIDPNYKAPRNLPQPVNDWEFED